MRTEAETPPETSEQQLRRLFPEEADRLAAKMDAWAADYLQRGDTVSAKNCADKAARLRDQ